MHSVSKGNPWILTGWSGDEAGYMMGSFALGEGTPHGGCPCVGKPAHTCGKPRKLLAAGSSLER